MYIFNFKIQVTRKINSLIYLKYIFYIFILLLIIFLKNKLSNIYILIAQYITNYQML